MQYPLRSFSTANQRREAHAALEAEHAGGRTVLRRQRVGYPFHVTRGFYLDAERPDLLTLYLQSASGGLYAGDRLHLGIVASRGAAIGLTTQASTVVQNGRGEGAVMQQVIDVGSGALCMFASDPYILFPGAELTLKTHASVADDGVLLMIDGFVMHDPKGEARPFARFDSDLRVTRPDGVLLMIDRGSVTGAEAMAFGGPMHGHGAVATLTLIAPTERLPDPAALEAAATQTGCLVGTSNAPNGAGLVMRLLARDGGTLARGMDAAFQVAGSAAAGVALSRRRK